jgi:transposase
VPVVPSCIIDPVREVFLASLPPHVDGHPLGGHNPRIADAVVFDLLVLKLVSGMGYERVADASCSATTLRRRRNEWTAAGVMDTLLREVLAAYDQMVGLELVDLPGDGCTVKAPGGGACAGPSPVDRRKQGTKRSQLVDGYGIPLASVPAPANTADHQLLDHTLNTLAGTVPGPLPDRMCLHLDAGYDNNPTRTLLAAAGLSAQIATKGTPAPIQVGKRWVVERTNSWMNNYGALRRTTERHQDRLEFYLTLATILITTRSLIRRAWYTHRWDTRPPRPRIR